MIIWELSLFSVLYMPLHRSCGLFYASCIATPLFVLSIILTGAICLVWKCIFCIIWKPIATCSDALRASLDDSAFWLTWKRTVPCIAVHTQRKVAVLNLFSTHLSCCVVELRQHEVPIMDVISSTVCTVSRSIKHCLTNPRKNQDCVKNFLANDMHCFG